MVHPGIFLCFLLPSLFFSSPSLPNASSSCTYIELQLNVTGVTIHDLGNVTKVGRGKGVLMREKEVVVFQLHRESSEKKQRRIQRERKCHRLSTTEGENEEEEEERKRRREEK